MAKHLLVFVAEKDGYDPIHTVKLDGDFKSVKCLVRRPIGWAENITEMVFKFFTHIKAVTNAPKLVERRQEVLDLFMTEIHTNERHLKREIAKHISKLHEVIEELEKCREAPKLDMDEESHAEEHERDELSHQPESV